MKILKGVVLLGLIVAFTSCAKDLEFSPINPVALHSQEGTIFQNVQHMALGNTVLSVGDVLMAHDFDQGGVQVSLGNNCTWKSEIAPLNLGADEVFYIQALNEERTIGSFLQINGNGSSKEVFADKEVITIHYYFNNQLAGTEDVSLYIGESVLSFTGSVNTFYYTYDLGEETFAFKLSGPEEFIVQNNTIQADKMSFTWGTTMVSQGAAIINMHGTNIPVLQINTANLYEDICGDIVEINEEVF